MADRAYLERLSRELADDGKLIEAGWIGLRLACGLANAPADQLREMRLAFLGGAQHLFSSIMSLLDPGVEETEADLRRMDLIHKELEAAQAELRHYDKPQAAPPAVIKQTLGDKPIEQKYRDVMNDLAKFIDAAFNGPDPTNKGGGPKTGFVLLTFAFGDDKGRCNYISNANRKDVVVLLKEQLARFEGSPDVTGHA